MRFSSRESVGVQTALALDWPIRSVTSRFTYATNLDDHMQPQAIQTDLLGVSSVFFSGFQGSKVCLILSQSA